jgi:hypothetical protein
MLRTDNDLPIFLHADQPFAQADPIHRAHYDKRLLDQHSVSSDMPNDVWQRYGHIVIGNRSGKRPLGRYAIDARRQRAVEK